MSLDDLVSQELGPYSFQTSGERVTAFVAATGDDADRWSDVPPPSFAAVGLFAAAGPFLSHPVVTAEARMMLHGDQSFRWLESFEPETTYESRAMLSRIRRRGPAAFVKVANDMRTTDGVRVAEASSTFVLSKDEPPGGEWDEEPEPRPDEAQDNDIPTEIELTAAGEGLPDIRKSASRADLVRYAAATRDWNPIHWDHGSAVEAGLPGVVCHGLLMASWVIQAAARTAPGPRPVSEAKIRFKTPLRPGVQALVTSSVEATSRLSIKVVSAKTTHVTASVAL